MTQKNYSTKINSFNITKNSNTMKYTNKQYTSNITKYNRNTNSYKQTLSTKSDDYEDNEELVVSELKKAYNQVISSARYITTGDTDDQTAYNPYKSIVRRATTGPLDLFLMTGINDKYKFITNYEEIDKDGFTVQGITEVDGLTYLSCHGSGPSRLYIYDKNKYIGYIILDQSSHVGGVTFDEKNKVMYVTNGGGNYSTYNMSEIKRIIDNEANYTNGKLKILLHPINTIDFYEFQDIISTNNADGIYDNLLKKPKNEIWDFYLDWREKYNKDDKEEFNRITYLVEKTHSTVIENDIEAKCTASTTYFYKGKLYTCEFDGDSSGTLSILEPKFDKTKYTGENKKPFISYDKTNETTISVPSRVQGIAVTEYEGNEYIVFSRSTGPFYSTITVYRKNADGSYTNMGDRNYSLGGMEGINIDENNQITVCFEFEEATMTMSMETLLNELHPEMFSFFPNLFQKIGGAFYESGGMSLISEWTSGWNRGLPYIPQALVGNVIYSGSIGSLVLLILEKTIIPEKLRDHEVYNDGIELLEDYIYKKYGKPFETLGDAVKEDGIFEGGSKGLVKMLLEYEIDKKNLLAKGIVYDGELVAYLLNKIPGVNIDMSAFKETAAYIDKYINYDKAKETLLKPVNDVKDVVDYIDEHKEEAFEQVKREKSGKGSGYTKPHFGF